MTVATAPAAVLEHRPGGFSIGEIELSAPLPGEVVVEIKAAGLCHSDWNILQGTGPVPALLGHEFAGIVKDVGVGVSEFGPGDHVAACLVASCGRCARCLEGDRVSCLDVTSTQRDSSQPPRLTLEGEAVWQVAGLGGFAAQTIVHESQLAKLDPAMPFDRAAVLGCAVATGAGTVIRAARVRPQQTVVVIGAGGVGLNAVQMSALVGARKIIVLDVQDDKLETARRFGATHVVNSRDTDPVGAVLEITGGLGVDHAFEMTGLAGPLDQAYALLGRGGTLYVVGMQQPGSTFAFPTTDLLARTSIRKVYMGSTNPKIDVPYYAELYLQGRFNLDDLVTRRISLDQIDDGYAQMLSGGGIGRTVITFD